MKFNREQLLATLSLLKPAIKSGGLIPELSHVWFADGEVFAYDGELGVRAELDAGLSCGVPGGVLLGLLATSKLADATVEPDESGAALKVKMGRSATKLASLDPERGVWPFPADDDAGEALEVTEALLAALRHVLVVEPKHATRPEHRGVMLRREKKSLALSTTDSATIAHARVEWEGKPGPVVILPRAFTEQVAKNCAPGADLIIRDDYLSAVGRDARYFTQVVDAADVRDMSAMAEDLAKNHPEPALVPHGLKVALERAALLDGRDEAVVDVQIKKGDLLITGSLKYGELSERAKLKGEHPDAGGQFTAGLVARGLAGAESVSLDEQAMLLRGADGALYAVAPRRAD